MMRSPSGWRRTLSLLVSLLGGAALAQVQRPLPRGTPEDLLTHAVQVHVVVDDTLEVDRLRALARPNVTAWVHTKNNTLSEATVENLARFDEVFVELHAPLASVDVAQFRRLPRVGVWLEPAALSLAARLPGAHRVAVRLPADAFENDALIDQVAALRPALVTWSPTSIDLLSWGRFKQLSGRKLVSGKGWAAIGSCGERSPTEPAAELHLANLLAASGDVFPCGLGMRVVLEPSVDLWLVQSLVSRNPSVELVFEVGGDAERASAVRVLLDALQIGPSR